MCGRYANHVKDMGAWVDILEDWPGDVTLGYNIAPTRTVPAFYKDREQDTTRGTGMRWGLVPAWSREINPISVYSYIVPLDFNEQIILLNYIRNL